MLYTVTNSGLEGINGRPTIIGSNTITISNGGSKDYEVSNFTTETSPQYSDPENDPLSYIKVMTLPSIGTLLVNGALVNIGDIIESGILSTSNFQYQAPVNPTGYTESWQFDVADTGSNSLSGLDTGLITMVVEPVENLPPSEVGDNIILLDHATSHFFNSSEFTSGTTPPYSDPEGDDPFQLKILDLPAEGTLVFNGVDVVVNQIINFTEIDAGYLVYNPNSTIITAQSLIFNFAVSDIVSGQFTT